MKASAMLLIFDWDGTLADSETHIVAAIKQSIGDMDLEARTDAQCASVIGLGLRESAQVLFPGLNDRLVSGFCERYRDNYLALGQREYPLALFDGVSQTLDTLLARGHRLAVATGKSRRGLNRVLSALNMEHYFVATRTADETASKPDPQMLQELLLETECKAEHAVMIGDTTYDMEMAVNAGIDRIAVNYGVHDDRQLSQYQPLLLLGGIKELLQWSQLG